MQFNLQKETDELRRRSPLSATLSSGFAICLVIGLLCAACGYALIEPGKPNPAPWIAVAVGSMLLIASAFIACFRFRRAKRLVTEGIVVAAKPMSVNEFLNGHYIARIRYQVDDRTYDKTLYVLNNGLGIAKAGFMLLAVLQSNPRIIEPMYSFATQKEQLDLVPGFRGLAKKKHSFSSGDGQHADSVNPNRRITTA